MCENLQNATVTKHYQQYIFKGNMSFQYMKICNTKLQTKMHQQLKFQLCNIKICKTEFYANLRTVYFHYCCLAK